MTTSRRVERLLALGFGGNRGDVALAIAKATETLAMTDGVDVVQASSLYRTLPVGRAKSQFLNSAVVIKTALPPLQVLTVCKSLERAAGRQRADRWDDRPLDVDILLGDDCLIRSSELSVPHPLLHLRRFALDPLNEIAGQWEHPVFHKTVAAITAHWRMRPLCVEVVMNATTPAVRTESAFPCEGRWGREIEWTYSDKVTTDVHLSLVDGSADAGAWPPQVDLGHWPLAREAALDALLTGVLDEPLLSR